MILNTIENVVEKENRTSTHVCNSIRGGYIFSFVIVFLIVLIGIVGRVIYRYILINLTLTKKFDKIVYSALTNHRLDMFIRNINVLYHYQPITAVKLNLVIKRMKLRLF